MDKENDLIYEAYLTEGNKAATLAMTIMCAIGIGGAGCASIGIEKDGIQPGGPVDELLDSLSNLAPLISQRHEGLPEEHKQYISHITQRDLEAVLSQADPDSLEFETGIKTGVRDILVKNYSPSTEPGAPDPSQDRY
tara:strand:+ start:726 stop:1136 length:411 start_codon:yes stop_codon:yes gene_type:complete